MFARMIGLTALIGLALPWSLTAGEPGKLREIDVKGLKIASAKGTVKAPKQINSAEELDKAIPGADAVKKQVDFGRESLVLFAWAGSGQDKVAATISDDGKLVAFRHIPGLTRDLRQHVRLFAIPKGAQFKVESGRGK